MNYFLFFVAIAAAPEIIITDAATVAERLPVLGEGSLSDDVSDVSEAELSADAVSAAGISYSP